MSAELRRLPQADTASRMVIGARPLSLDEWLSRAGQCLVWPGEDDRAQRLAAAIASARRDPPAVHRGDLLSDLPALAARAPAGATLVVYHSSVLWYVAADQREHFAGTVRRLGATWLSSEPPGVVPGTAGARPETDASSRDELLCALARDGHPLALADSHGTWLHWLR